jgi:hypothetical protein
VPTSLGAPHLPSRKARRSAVPAFQLSGVRLCFLQDADAKNAPVGEPNEAMSIIQAGDDPTAVFVPVEDVEDIVEDITDVIERAGHLSCQIFWMMVMASLPPQKSPFPPT